MLLACTACIYLPVPTSPFSKQLISYRLECKTMFAKCSKHLGWHGGVLQTCLSIPSVSLFPHTCFPSVCHALALREGINTKLQRITARLLMSKWTSPTLAVTEMTGKSNVVLAVMEILGQMLPNICNVKVFYKTAGNSWKPHIRCIIKVPAQLRSTFDVETSEASIISVQWVAI